MKKTALVLEGGAMRGVYTAGVLDVFAENALLFPYVIGISAGALNALSYLSGQPGRNLKVTMEYAGDPRYFGVQRFIKDRNYFNFDFLFGQLSNELLPFDWEGFEKSPQRFTAVACSCLTGRPAYFEKGDGASFFQGVRASASMPVFSKMVKIDGVPYLDGGVALPTARCEALRRGYDKQVLVLTRPKGYRKGPLSRSTRLLYARAFKGYPAFLQKLLTVPERYNAEMALIDEMEARKELFVIRPNQPVWVHRTEKDLEKLEALYWEGRIEAEALLPFLQAYLTI